MAVIVPSLNLLFFLSPGTGSTSLSTLLVNQFGGKWVTNNTTGKHTTPKELINAGVDIDRYLCVTTTRHPLDFYISQYHKKRTWPGAHDELVFAKNHAFSEFLARQFQQQPDNLIHPVFLNKVDVVFRKECLLSDFNAFLKELGHNTIDNLPNINVSHGLVHDFSFWYTPEDLRNALDKYAEHFTRFGYTPTSLFPQKPLSFPKEKIRSCRRANKNFVLPGNNGWLFLSDASNRVVSQVKGNFNYKEHWGDQWEKEIRFRSDVLSNAGIAPYKLFIPPNTHSIIGNKFISGFKVSMFRPCDYLAKLQGCKGVMYDLSPHLRETDPEKTFCKGDSHWSQYGAYLGYVQICKELGARHLDISHNDFEFKEYLGDLSNKLPSASIEKYCCLSDVALSRICKSVKCIFNNHVEVTGMFRFFESDAPLNNKSLLLFGDSYSYSLLNFFSSTFSRFYFVHIKSFDASLVKILLPDYVISIVAERFLVAPPFHSNGGWRDDYTEKLLIDNKSGIVHQKPIVNVVDSNDPAFNIFKHAEKIHKETFKTSQITAEEIELYYRCFFGRMPSIPCILDKQARHKNLNSLHNEFLTSSELTRRIDMAQR
jgi:hypothetical protein